jgi:transcriptional regulator with XRE-family HTH domain
MSKLKWLPEHGEQLKSLRTAAGIDISTLASNHALSKMQIKQLEEGGESAFYTPEIKFTIGRKLIRSFGVEALNIEQKQVLLETHLSKVVVEYPSLQERSRVSINSKYLIFFVVGFIVLVYFSYQSTGLI